MQRLQWQQSVPALIGAARRHIKQAAWNRLKPHGVTPQQAGILSVLAEEAPLTSRALADHLCMDTPTASRVLRSLVKRGMVETKEDPSDRRCDRLELSARGARLYERVRPIVEELRAGIARGISPEERRTLAGLLERIIDNSKRLEGRGR